MIANPNHIRLSDHQPHRARIFLSCGQAAPDEKEFAQDLKKELESEKYNFQVFVAITENTIKDLDRELLDHLKISDYFLFINFRREIISNTHDKQCSYRGSLYTNQELAMACAVGFTSENMLIFSEEGIDRDGLLKTLVTNNCDFTDKKQLRKLILHKIKDWDYRYSRCLLVSGVYFNDGPWDWKLGKKSEWIAVMEIENKRSQWLAANCVAHLKSIQTSSGEFCNLEETYPLKACGIDHFSHTVWPNSTVKFDMLSIHVNGPQIYLHTQRDRRYEPIAEGTGIYFLTYEVYAENFPVIEVNVDLAVGANFDDKDGK